MNNNNNEIDKTKLIKGKIYCKNCRSEIYYNKDINYYESKCNCKNKFYMTLQWCEECQDFTNHRGLGNVCVRCQMTKHNQSDLMRKVSTETNLKCKKYKKMIAALPEDYKIECKDCKKFEECEFSDIIELNTFHNNVCMTVLNQNENIKKANSERLNEAWKDPEYAKKIASNLGDYLGNPEWARIVGIEGRKALAKIFEEDPTFGRKIISEALKYLDEHPEARGKGLKKVKENKIKKIQNKIDSFNFKLNSIPIKNEDIRNLKQNDICGAYVLKAKFKGYKGTKRENEVFKLLPCKSKYIYDEMNWEQRVCSQPEKQDWIITLNNPWNIAKWWYISNLYYDFEFELLTDPNGVTEDEALYAEYSYADKNDLYVEFTTDEKGRRIPIVEKHAYWSP